MQTAIFQSESKKDLTLQIRIAKRIGVTTKLITDKEFEDIGLCNAIKEGRTGKHVNTEKFIKNLKSSLKEAKDIIDGKKAPTTLKQLLDED